METMTQTLHMQVDGEFITELARTWFWDEHRPIQVSIDLLGSCIQNATQDEIQTITTSILEGRKKFVGINDFELIDDNENIRPLSLYITNQEKKKGISDIKLDMMSSFAKYVDVWSTIKSSHPGVLAQQNFPTSFQECKHWYTMERTDYNFDEFENIYIKDTALFETPTRGGLWLIDYPELVYDACKGDMTQIGKPDFWKQIYEYKKDDPAFKDRNERYLFSIRPKPTFEERMEILERMYEKKLAKEEPKPMYLTDEWFDYQYRTTHESTYNMEPDNIETWEGLIAPNGDFYSCQFGSHNIKAYYLLIKHPELINSTREEIEYSDTIRSDNALDIIVERCGWCATRSVMFDQYIMPPYPKKPTKHQVNRILDAIIKHNVKINTEELCSFLD